MIARFSAIAVVIFLLSCHPSVRYSSRSQADYEKRVTSTKLTDFVRRWLHVPYRYGGDSMAGIDCSGLVVQLMQQVYGIRLPRQASDQYRQGTAISRSQLQAGNLVFFSTGQRSGIDHVGVYLGDDNFVHASENGGVIVSSLNDDYYTSRFAGACRY
jgi:cell wall-associated NlpC family hydrolase